ncbi:MAG: DUF6154 family protein [Bacillaceae bacterium]|uniref:DUF6154 family protein n=2 Tax=Bacillaceae TaxID=186817 RepID=A0ABT5VG39_9BACI|nr:DUF6154 family protein [Alkalihalobacterium chitinilyticum]MEB1807091.1 DUF6154 family protein [Bacillaceae bacterium]
MDMKFVDDLYEMYKNHLTGDEEDAYIIVDGILQEISKEDVKKLIDELSDNERFEMFGMYLYETFRLKVAQEGIGETLNEDDQGKGYIH